MQTSLKRGSERGSKEEGEIEKDSGSGGEGRSS